MAVTQRIREWTGRHSLLFLRASLSVVFVWFGALKLAGVSPVETMVADAVPLLAGGWFVPLLGIFEVVLGLAVLVSSRPVVVATMLLHLAGTFLVLLTSPDLAFQRGNLLLPSTEGEFVVKNLVLLSAAWVIYVTGRQGGGSASTYW